METLDARLIKEDVVRDEWWIRDLEETITDWKEFKRMLLLTFTVCSLFIGGYSGGVPGYITAKNGVKEGKPKTEIRMDIDYPYIILQPDWVLEYTPVGVLVATMYYGKRAGEELAYLIHGQPKK